MPSASSSENCVSIRARVRKSRRAIDPEFDACVETLVSFVDNGTSKKNKGGLGLKSLLLTPVILPTTTNVATRVRSLSRGGSLAPVKRRHRSFADGGVVGEYYSRSKGSVTTSSNSGNGSDNEGMVDVSLEDEQPPHLEGGEAIETNAAHHGPSTNPTSGGLSHHPAGLPKHPSIHSNIGTNNNTNNNGTTNNSRYSSPLAVLRTSSAISHTSIISSTHSDHLSGSVRSQNSRNSARSRSRSRSRRRMGSFGAARAFATAGSSGSGAGAGAGASLSNGHLEEEGVGGADGSGSYSAALNVDPISIPLKDILSVDEEVPSRNHGGGGSSSHSNGGGGGSDFYSSAASDVGVAKEAASAANATDHPSSSTPKSPSPPPYSSNSIGNKVPYRIFLRTLSHGYVEFSLDHANSHDIFMAYLKAHLPPDRIPQRNGGDGANSKQNQHQHHQQGGVAGSGGMLRTMVLTPTKEIPSNLSGSTTGTSTVAATNNGNSSASNTHSNTISSQLSQSSHTRQPPPTSQQPHLTRSSSTTSYSVNGTNAIDKLHTKAIRQRLQNESTPLMRMKERMANIMSNMMDCALCCQDTTTVAPVIMESESGEKGVVFGGGSGGDKVKLQQHQYHGNKKTSSSQQQQQQYSPNSEKLRNKGIGGLSFEELSSGGTPKLSFEKSMSGGGAVG